MPRDCFNTQCNGDQDGRARQGSNRTERSPHSNFVIRFHERGVSISSTQQFCTFSGFTFWAASRSTRSKAEV